MIGDCSKILKIKVSKDFIIKGIKPKVEKWRNKEYLKDENFTDNPILYYGISFEEFHRVPKIRKNWPYTVEFPLVDNIINNEEVLKKYGLKQPLMYDLAFSHNNCKGRCVKAGTGHYKNLLEKMPEVFHEIMVQEHYIKLYVSSYRYITQTEGIPQDEIIPEHVQEVMLQELDDAFRDYFYGKASKPKLYIHPSASAAPEYFEIKEYSFMKKSTNGVVKPYPIRELYYRLTGKPFDTYGIVPGEPRQLDLFAESEVDLFDFGGCSCAVDF